ncbi:unnamed protein product [Rotaria socialis]|uniref:Uncharacterized protein n=1 Tax=Rotaria socialis TaxID=392032 RepID=A0A818EPV5_9BILA|nr:unnamed protein product [Rotaria socialis]CAF3462509.1 unnamed protein product [Rotaria socialis]
MNCKEYRQGEKMLQSWPVQIDQNQYNAQKCPRCKIHISLRHTVRGLVAGAASLAIPVAAVGAVALLAVGTTIGAPTYGTYRLVKHIHSKRQERRQRYRTKTIARHWNTSDSLSTDDQMIESDDIRRTVQAIA